MDNYTPKPINIDLLKEIIREYHPEKALIKGEKKQKTPQKVPAPKVHPVQAKKTATAPSPKLQQSLPKSKPLTPVVVEAKDILIYIDRPLSASLQVRALEEEGYRVDHVRTESVFLEKLDTTHYRYVLVESKLLPMEGCFMEEVLAEKNTLLYLWGDKTSQNCPQTESYKTIPELRKILGR